MPSRIQIRRDTAANWTSVDPVLAQGEIGFEYDTRKSKIGDGTSAWTSLGYVIEESFSTADKAKLCGCPGRRAGQRGRFGAWPHRGYCGAAGRLHR